MGVYMHVQCHVFSIELWHYIIIYALFMHTIVVSKFIVSSMLCLLKTVRPKP